MSTPTTPRDAFFHAAVWHGPLDEAQALLAAHPELAAQDIHTAALLGDDAAIARFLALDPALAADASSPLGWDPLTLLCFSRFLRLDAARAESFLHAATALLDAGADPNTGFFDSTHSPSPTRESVLYAAAGVAHNGPITRLLLARGADPNDDEVPYHSPESYKLDALQALLDSDRLTADSLATMLLRKADWHDTRGIRVLLAHGADPNRGTIWGFTALHQALRRDNHLDNIELMLDYGANPSLPASVGPTGFSIAARRGRADVLAAFERRGIPISLSETEKPIAACARGQHIKPQSLDTASSLLAEFAGNDNAAGLACLLDTGVPVDAPYPGDPYFEIPPGSTALHVACWRAAHAAVRTLIGRGANVHRPDANGRTPLALAIRANTVSYWAYRRRSNSIRALLRAGAIRGK